MPRQKLYADAAERTRAYRERQALRRGELAPKPQILRPTKSDEIAEDPSPTDSELAQAARDLHDALLRREQSGDTTARASLGATPLETLRRLTPPDIKRVRLRFTGCVGRGGCVNIGGLEVTFDRDGQSEPIDEEVALRTATIPGYRVEPEG